MVIDMTDFEYQKENIIPLPQGRSAKVLSALYAKDSVIEKTQENNTTPEKNSNSLTGKEIREIRRKEFENELKDIEEVDDPLNTYFKYILWIQDNYPNGNDIETGLLSLLETVLKKYQGDPRYLNDSRYLRLWFLYAHYSHEPIEIFKFLSVNEIGQNLSTYYEEYALFMETQNKYKEANEIYTLGINRKAQPIERLKKRYIEFQKRMILTVNKQPEETDSSQQDSNHVKSSFLNMKSKNNAKRVPLQVKHVSSTASELSHNNDQNHNPNIGRGNNNTSFTIFEDKEKPKDIKDELFGGQQDQQNHKDVFHTEQSKHLPRTGSLILPTADETNEWSELGSHNLRRKENIRELESWNNVTLPQKASLVASRFSRSHGRSPVSFKIYEDPIEPEYSSPLKKTPKINRQDNQVVNAHSSEPPKNIEVHRCLMNMIYALSITDLYKEIVKEKERILSRKRSGLRNERMNENLKKLDEKTFNKIKKNIDWSYNPQKNEYYNSFECKHVSEFSIEEIRARYYEKRNQKKSREEEEETSPTTPIVRRHHSKTNTPSSSHSSSNKNIPSNHPPLKKSRSIIQIDPNSNFKLSKSLVTNNPSSAILSSYDKNNENKENNGNTIKRNRPCEDYDNDETRYTVKQDLKLFMPHDLSSEILSPPHIPRKHLLTNSLNKINNKNSSIVGSSIKTTTTTTNNNNKIIKSESSHSLNSNSTIKSNHVSPTSIKTISSSTLLKFNQDIRTPTPNKSNHINTSITSPSSNFIKLYHNNLRTPSPIKPSQQINESNISSSMSSDTKINSSISNINSNSQSDISLGTTSSNSNKENDSNTDPFSRHESFHYKNSPTVTIHTKNAFAAVYEWFNEPCDEENMDNLYMDNTMNNSDIDNTFFLKRKK